MTGGFLHQFARSGRSFTLIEMLSVIVIVSLVASVTAISLTSVDDASRLAQVGARLLELDARARLHAQGLDEVVSLAFDDEHFQCRLQQVDGDLLDEVELPRGVTAEFEVDNSPTVIVFDRLGQSTDYTIILRGATQSKRWRVAGLSGWIEAEESP